jgi:prepilin-type N-terminal cleavage/methylation domain-containing protein
MFLKKPDSKQFKPNETTTFSHGFTLVEILAVLAIVGILSVIGEVGPKN